MHCGMQYSECISNDITVSAYLQLSDSAVSDGGLCWDYSLRFENNSNDDVVLLGKKLSVIDAHGHMTSVDFDGFKGQLPQLIPGDDFEDVGYVTSKSSAIFTGSCKVKIGNQIKNIELPAFNLVAGNERNFVLN